MGILITDYDLGEIVNYMTGGGSTGSEHGTIGLIFTFFREVGMVACPVGLILLIITTFIQRNDDKAVKKNIQTMIVILILYAVLLAVFKDVGSTGNSLLEFIQ